MKSILSTSSTYLSANSFSTYKTSTFLFTNVCFSSSPYPSPSWSVASSKLSVGPRKLVISGAKQRKKNERKEDSHSFVARPDEATGIFPEAVLLKEVNFQVHFNCLLLLTILLDLGIKTRNSRFLLMPRKISVLCPFVLLQFWKTDFIFICSSRKWFLNLTERKLFADISCDYSV